ncbi:MAG: hypothetical protein IJ875_04410 [Solobacterium sp.]|nr:hypothetical protein [Solobacterium sp.]
MGEDKKTIESKEKQMLTLDELDEIAGGYNNEEWAQWTRAWKDWWKANYGAVRCWNCQRFLNGVIEGYDKDMAYDVYMNNAFKCVCGQIIRPVKGWK